MTEPRRPRFLAQIATSPVATPASFAKAAPSCHAAPVPEPPRPAPEAAPIDVAAIRRDAMERVAEAVATLRAHADHLAERARSDTIEIAFQVAAKILETEVRTNPEALFALVRSALRRAGDSRRITIRVAPDDALRVRSEEARAALDGITAARIEIVADLALQGGDCIVEADFGQVDGRLATRLAEVRRAVDAAHEGVA